MRAEHHGGYEARPPVSAFGERGISRGTCAAYCHRPGAGAQHFSGVTGHRLGSSSRPGIASLNPRYHLSAASECTAFISLSSWARSRWAREVILTECAIIGFELREKFLRGPNLPLLSVLRGLRPGLPARGGPAGQDDWRTHPHDCSGNGGSTVAQSGNAADQSGKYPRRHRPGTVGTENGGRLIWDSGVLGLLLAVIGVYGVMMYTVLQRTSEIGIRMAVGAGQIHVIGMILWQSMRLVSAGIALGACGALAITGLVRSLLFNVSPTDPVTFLSVAAILGGTALLAGAIPAWRASRIDPILALRQE